MRHRYQPRRSVCRHCGQRIHLAFGAWWDAHRSYCLPGAIRAMHPTGPDPQPGRLGFVDHQPTEEDQ